MIRCLRVDPESHTIGFQRLWYILWSKHLAECLQNALNTLLIGFLFPFDCMTSMQENTDKTRVVVVERHEDAELVSGNGA